MILPDSSYLWLRLGATSHKQCLRDITWLSSLGGLEVEKPRLATIWVQSSKIEWGCRIEDYTLANWKCEKSETTLLLCAPSQSPLPVPLSYPLVCPQPEEQCSDTQIFGSTRILYFSNSTCWCVQKEHSKGSLLLSTLTRSIFHSFSTAYHINNLNAILNCHLTSSLENLNDISNLSKTELLHL